MPASMFGLLPARFSFRLVGLTDGRWSTRLSFHLVFSFNEGVDRLLIVGIRCGVENAVNVISCEGRREIRVTPRQVVFYPAD